MRGREGMMVRERWRVAGEGEGGREGERAGEGARDVVAVSEERSGLRALERGRSVAMVRSALSLTKLSLVVSRDLRYLHVRDWLARQHL